MAPERHGFNRLTQRENALGRVIGFKQQGIHKKIAALSIGQLRTMFPQHALLSEPELRIIASKELLEKNK